jgi:hypothetical protein
MSGIDPASDKNAGGEGAKSRCAVFLAQATLKKQSNGILFACFYP